MSTLHEWIEEAKTALGIDLEVDVNEILDVAKVVAHHVARPAAPLAAFLVGYAAAQAGGGAAAVSAASHTATALAHERPAIRPDDS